jgi:hypothetical protein
MKRRTRPFNPQRFTRTNPDYLTPKQAWDAEIAAQQYADAAPLRRAQAVVDEFQQEIAAVNNDLLWYRDTPFSQMTEEDAPVDVLTDYEMRPEGTRPPIALQFTEAWNEAYGEFARMVDAKGLVFSPDAGEAIRKLCAFVRILSQKRNIALTAGNFWLAFRKLYSLGVITSNDVSGFVDNEAIPSRFVVTPIPQAPQAPAKKPVDPMELWSTEKRDELQMIFGIVNKDWQAEFLRWATAWSDSLLNNFNYSISDKLLMKTAEFLQARNLSPFRCDSWDAARRYFVSCGMMPDSMLTDQERLNALIDGSDLSNPGVRRMINIKQQEILDQNQRRG